MFNILTLNNISESGTSLLPAETYTLSSNAEIPEGVLLRSYSMHDMELPTSLHAIARAGAGVNNIPIDKCSELGIVVFNTPGANANAVKELVIAALLISSRKIVEGINWSNSLKGQKDVAKTVEKGKAEFVGPEIAGKKLGVVGLGAIGVMVANAANSLGMEVLGYDPFISIDAAWGLSRSIKKSVSLDTIFAECDYITVHVPLNDKTKDMFNDETLKKVKKGVKILNLSRAELVNNTAMKDALEQDIVSCYVTDFPTEEILEVKNVIAIPHLGASTPESEDNCAAMAAIEIRDFLEFGNIKNSVNFPNCELPYTGKTRVTICHKNIPNVMASITTAFAKNNFNIDNMINKSKGNFAYTIIDVDQDNADEVVLELLGIEGVIKVRII